MIWREEPPKSRLGSAMYPPMKQFIVFLVGWIGFQLFATSLQLTLTVVGKLYNVELSSLGYSMTVNTICYVAMIIALILISNRDVLKLLPSFKQWQSYLAAVICFASIMAFTISYNIFIETLQEFGILNIPVSDNANQAAIVSLESKFPFTSLVVFGLIGPICEELTYRVGLFSLIKRKNKALAYILTIIIFAFIHFNFSTNTTTLINEFINLPYYMFAAFAFSFTYDKFGFAGSATAHVINNVYSLLVSILLH